MVHIVRVGARTAAGQSRDIELLCGHLAEEAGHVFGTTADPCTLLRQLVKPDSQNGYCTSPNDSPGFPYDLTASGVLPVRQSVRQPPLQSVTLSEAHHSLIGQQRPLGLVPNCVR